MPVHSFVLPPAEQESYWQPGPSHGWMTTVLTPEILPSATMALAVQGLDPECQIRPHAHMNMDEILLILEGTGTLLMDGTAYACEPGTSCWLGRYVRHQLLVDDAPMRVLAILLPPGTELAWRGMGKPRRQGDAPPPRYGREELGDLAPLLDAAGFARAEAIEAPPPGAKGIGLVVGADEGRSWWQPRPTGGYVTVKYGRHNTPSNLVEMGTQVIPPRGMTLPVRDLRADTIVYVASGAGVVSLDGAASNLVADTAIFAGRGAELRVEATGDAPLELVWVRTPPAPRSAAELLGRDRIAGQAPPAFDAPSDARDLAARQAILIG